MAGGKTPTHDLYAVIDPDNPDNEDSKSTWIKMGPLWPTQNKDVLSGHIESIPLEMLRGGKLHIAVQRRRERDDDGGSSSNRSSSSNRNRR